MITEAFQNMFRGAATSVDGTHPKDPALRNLFGTGMGTRAGVAVDERKALSYPPILRGVNILANGVKKAPLDVYQMGEAGRTVDKSHSSRKLIRKNGSPNSFQTIGVFKQTLTAWALLWGNGCAYIQRNNRGEATALIPLLPDRTGIFRKGGGDLSLSIDGHDDLMYYSMVKGTPKVFEPENIFHIRGLSSNGLWGLRVVELMRESIGGHIAVSEHGNSFFGSGCKIQGFVNTPHGLTEEAAERFQDSLTKATTGDDAAFKIVALEEMTKFWPMTMSNEDSQFLATKEFDVREAALIIGIQPSKVGDRKEQSYNALTESNQEHKDDDLAPWFQTWSEEGTDKLLTEEQKETESHEVDFDDSGLNWVPFKERIEGASKAYNDGLADQTEGRSMIGLPPVSDNPNAHKFRRPVNIGHDTDSGGQVVTESIDSSAVASEPLLIESFDDLEIEITEPTLAESLAESELTRIATRLSKQARKKAENPADFIKWLDELDEKQGPKSIYFLSEPMVNTLKTELNDLLNSETSDTFPAALKETLSEFEKMPNKAVENMKEASK